MNRRKFFGWLGAGAAAPVVAKALPAIEEVVKEIPGAKPEPMKAAYMDAFTAGAMATACSFSEFSFKESFSDQEFED